MSSLKCSSIIWRLDKLTHLQLDMNESFHRQVQLSSSIEYLSIRSQNRWSYDIVNLFQQTPYMRRLHLILNDFDTDFNVKLPSLPLMTKLKLSNVRSLSMMTLLLQALSNLTHLKVDMNRIECDGYQWEQIIDEN
jgi:hypothetical protein